MATYLVTGVAGFIASRVAEMLLAEGHSVVGVDNLNDYYDVRVKDWRLSRLLGAASTEQRAGSPRPDGDPKRSAFACGSGQPAAFSFQRFQFRHLDIEDATGLDAIFAEFKFDAVFNLAARAGVRYSMENPRVYLSTNALGTLNVLESMRAHGVKKHVLASTSSLYAGCPMPFREDQPVNTPLSPYAATKKAAEMLAYSYHRLHGIDSTVLRYFTVFGPAGRPDMSPFRFIKWIDEGTPLEVFGDGTQARDFTFVDDIARGTILAGRLVGGRMMDDESQASRTNTRSSAVRSQFPDSSGYNIINLGGGRNPITLHAMIGTIERELGKKAVLHTKPFSAADMKETWADIAQAETLLGWKPGISVEEGFRRTVAWHVENRDWLRHVQV